MKRKDKLEMCKQLLPYCNTEKQRERLQAIIDHDGNQSKASKALGQNNNSVNDSVEAVKRIARSQGYQYSRESFKPIVGHFVKAESALVDKNGNVQMKWVKTDTNKELKLEELRKAITSAFEDYKGESIEIKAPTKASDGDLLCMIPIGDAHFGMMAWAPESGEDFDLKKSESLLIEAVDRLIDSAPNAETCLIADMGDFLHRNDNKNSTPASGNVLDCDSRSLKMMRVAVKTLIHCIHSALEKFPKVILRNVLGNHSPEGEQMLGLAMELYFHNNPRVVVENSPNKFWYYHFGRTLLGFHHGDKIKQPELPLIMASDAAKEWGDSDFRYFFIGHIHHQSVKEYQGCSVESINTLTPNDAWHHGSGYRARKNIKLLVFHKDYGEVERITKDVSMITSN